jgi:hypothetical protein
MRDGARNSTFRLGAHAREQLVSSLPSGRAARRAPEGGGARQKAIKATTSRISSRISSRIYGTFAL